MVFATLFRHATELLSSFTVWNLLIISGALLYINWRRTPHPKFPPGPKGVPLLGVVPFLSGQPGRDFKKWSLKYGPIFSVRLGMESVVVFNDFNSINQALVKQGNIFSDRPWIQLFCGVTKQHGIIFKNYGDDFKSQKHFALKYLRENGLGRKKMEILINEELDIFVKYIRDVQNASKEVDLKQNALVKKYYGNGGPVYLCFKYQLYQATSNVISRVIFGTRSDYGDPSFNKLLEALSLMQSDSEHDRRQSLILIWDVLAKFPYFRTAMRVFNERMAYIMKKMHTRVIEHKNKFDPKHIDDYIDAYLLEQNVGKPFKKKEFTDVQLTTNCRDFFVAGSETSSTTIAWLFVQYLNFPEFQTCIDQEIKDVLGSSGIPTMEKRQNMPHTCAFIQEGMRHRAIAPLALRHRTTTQVQLDGFVIPKGTNVIPNLQGAHLDPEDWPNPEKFDPYRHIDKNGQFVNSIKIIPFSIGSRFCLGESLARVEVFMFFVKILQKFHVNSARNYLPPLDNEICTAILSPRECVVQLKER